MNFRKYNKIFRLGKDETTDILKGLCYIEEKIDGSNTSAWLRDGNLCLGSRNREVTGDDFSGFCEYMDTHEPILKYLLNNENHIVYGEWLVKHTVNYSETAYKKFYMFDIWDGEKYMEVNEIYRIGKEYGFNQPELFDTVVNPTVEYLKKFLGKSVIGEHGEGIVIKNLEFKNKFGDLCYAKMVTDEFIEKNKLVFGGNNRFSDTYWETYIVNKYITLGRVKKIMNKIAPEIGESFDMKHIPRVCQTVYHDMITEEAWEIANKVSTRLSYKDLRRQAFMKSKQIFVDILNDQISVSDANPHIKNN